MAFAEGHNINPQAFTGDNLASTLTNLNRSGDGENNKGLWVMSGSTSTLPIHVEIQHSTIRKGKAKYQRSTIAFQRKALAAPSGDPEAVGATGYTTTQRIVIEKPMIGGVITDAAFVQDLGRLLSFFGVTLSTSGTPSATVQKFLLRET